MSNYYDNILIKSVENHKIYYRLIADLSYYIEKLRTRFPFVGSRINFNNLNSNIYLKSDQKNISVDATSFIENLIEEKNVVRMMS